MDHGLVKRMRAEVGDRPAEQRRLDAASGVPPMSGEDERQFARALVAGAFLVFLIYPAVRVMLGF